MKCLSEHRSSILTVAILVGLLAIVAGPARYWEMRAISARPTNPGPDLQKLAIFHERYNEARPHWALRAAEPESAPARILSPHEVYVKGYKVNPPKWSRWVGWLEKDQETAAEPSNRTPVPVSA